MTAPRPAPSRRTLTAIVAPIIVLLIIGTVGNAIHPALLRTKGGHPLLLIAMDPVTRWLLLTADRLPLLPFFIVAVVRRLISHPLFYLLGRLYGDNAVRWAEHRFDNNTGLIRTTERLFRRGAPVMVFLVPGSLVCVLAGATGMAPWTFAILNVVGTMASTVAIYFLAQQIKGPLDAVNRFYGHYYKWLLALSIVFTLYWLWDQKRKGKMPSLEATERELEGDVNGPPEPAA